MFYLYQEALELLLTNRSSRSNLVSISNLAKYALLAMISIPCNQSTKCRDGDFLCIEFNMKIFILFIFQM